jgi:hypothetical protein
MKTLKKLTNKARLVLHAPKEPTFDTQHSFTGEINP